MAHNIEIKAYLQKTDALRARVEELADEGPETLVQEDVFFESAEGRLKLRKSSAGAELIYYERPDDKAPVESQYMKTVVDGAELEAILSIALGVRGTVRKGRDVYRIGQTRIHVDEVDGLGSFVELEVELRGGQTPSEGEAIARDLMKQLGVIEGDLVAEAYIDLLEIPQQPEEPA